MNYTTVCKNRQVFEGKPDGEGHNGLLCPRNIVIAGLETINAVSVKTVGVIG